MIKITLSFSSKHFTNFCLSFSSSMYGFYKSFRNSNVSGLPSSCPVTWLPICTKNYIHSRRVKLNCVSVASSKCVYNKNWIDNYEFEFDLNKFRFDFWFQFFSLLTVSGILNELSNFRYGAFTNCNIKWLNLLKLTLLIDHQPTA